MASWRQPLESDVESPTRRAILSGRGGVGGGEPPQTTDSGDSMSSSDDEEGGGRAFKPGQDNPEDFFQEVRVKTAKNKRRGVTPCASLLGEIISRISNPDDAAELLQWVDDDTIPVPPIAGGPPVNVPMEGAPAVLGPNAVAAVAACSVEQLQRAFVLKFPLTGAQDMHRIELRRHS